MTLPATVTNTEIGDLSMEDMDAMLATLSVPDAEDADILETIGEEEPEVTEEAVIEETPVETEPVAAAAVLSEDEIQELEIDITRSETYEEQTADTADVTVEAIADTSAAKPKKAAKAPKTPRVSVNRDLNTIEVGAFILSSSTPPDDLAANRAAVIATKPVQKKIAEKFENVISSLAAGKLPSTFVVDAYKVLKAKSSATSSDLVAAFKADGYNEGTARSQVGQIMALFPVLQIASRSGSTIVLNDDSALGARLQALLDKAA